MKKEITVLFSDLHLKEENYKEIEELIIQACELSKSLGIKEVFCLGDIFDSRLSQKLSVLTSFGDILDTFKRYNITLIAIPGNHDKTIYTDKVSFLNQYKFHPNFRLIDFPTVIFKNNIDFVLMPYFEENLWLNYYHNFLKSYDSKSYKILLTHIGITGSLNNDGSQVESILKVGTFDYFDKIFSGHYHDQQQIGSKFFHIPSIKQNNYGENEEKGFTIIYSDGSSELIHSKFKKYIKRKFDLNNVSLKEIEEFANNYSNTKDYVRFEITGDENKLKSFNKKIIEDFGIDVKTKSIEIENNIEKVEKSVIYNKSLVLDEFEKFCKKKNLDFKVGKNYLLKILK